MTAAQDPAERVTRCRWCEASGDGEPREAIRRLMGCNNCLADLGTGGGWTGGIPRAILEELVARHGRKYVAAIVVDEEARRAAASRRKRRG